MKPLTRDDIIALKQADHIIFQSVYMHGRSNVGIIVCTKQTDKDDYNTWEVKVASAVQFLDDSLIEPNCFCCFLIHNSFVSWTWQTIAGTLLPEDEIELLWMPDAESSYPLIEAGFHCDILRIIVYRQKYRFHYTVGVLIAKDGTGARMLSGLTKLPTKEMITL